MKRIFKNFFSLTNAYAHCDVPCGIYDTANMKISANTILKMVQKIKELENAEHNVTTENSLTRMIMTKEEHSRICKQEILILWTDFFKPEDLTIVPNLHEIIWSTTKLISKNKQEVNIEAANELIEKVNEIDSIFHKVKDTRAK